MPTVKRCWPLSSIAARAAHCDDLSVPPPCLNIDRYYMRGRLVDIVTMTRVKRSAVSDSRLSRWTRRIGPVLFGALAMTLVMSPGISAAQGSAEAGAGPAGFIRVLGDQRFAVIRSAVSPPEKIAYFRQMLRQDFDLPDICRFVLGPYWRVASGPQRREFRVLLQDHLLHFFGDRLAQYGGESFRVTGTRADPAGGIVTSQIVRLQGPPIGVDWRLKIRDGYYKVGDVIVDGVSMAAAQRSEISAMIQRNGGQAEGLLATIRGQI
jgi:phospholipid transport system substrate-binding protein